MTAYASWSVVFGEQPSAAKWNILGTNDSAFNDGTGIANLSWVTTALANAYKFGVYRNAAQNSGSAAFSKISYDTEEFDSNSNFDNATNFTYTAPVTGYYQFNARCSVQTGTRFILSLFKNAAEFKRGGDNSSSNTGDTLSTMIALTAADTVDIRAFGSAPGLAMDTGQNQNYFQGYLITRT